MTVENKLDALYKLRLLYNSSAELMKVLETDTHSNNSLSRKGGKSEFLKKAILHELSHECNEQNGLDLEEVLEEYATVTTLIEKYRGVTAGKAWNKKAATHCIRLLEILVFNEKPTDDDSIEIRKLCDSLAPDNSLQMALTVLILLGALPKTMR